MQKIKLDVTPYFFSFWIFWTFPLFLLKKKTSIDSSLYLLFVDFIIFLYFFSLIRFICTWHWYLIWFLIPRGQSRFILFFISIFFHTKYSKKSNTKNLEKKILMNEIWSVREVTSLVVKNQRFFSSRNVSLWSHNAHLNTKLSWMIFLWFFVSIEIFPLEKFFPLLLFLLLSIFFLSFSFFRSHFLWDFSRARLFSIFSKPNFFFTFLKFGLHTYTKAWFFASFFLKFWIEFYFFRYFNATCPFNVREMNDTKILILQKLNSTSKINLIIDFFECCTCGLRTLSEWASACSHAFLAPHFEHQ